jgi:membrane-associated protein
VYLAGRGGAVLVPIRFVSVLHAVAPVVAGTVRMPLVRFVAWSGLGALAWGATYTAVGTAAGAAYQRYGHLGLVTSVAVLGAVAALPAIRRVRRRRPAPRPAHRPTAPAPAPSCPAVHHGAASAPDRSECVECAAARGPDG